MKNHLILFLAIMVSWQISAQETASESKVVHVNQIKVGFSNQIDVMFQDRYFDYYSDEYYYNDPGVNFQLFLAYEHIWEFPNKVAFALEPKIGTSIRQKGNNGFIGLNTKVYWANTDVWRMGMAIYSGYGYTSRDFSIDVPMGGGNYYQKKDLRMHFHSYSFDIGFIPFQFRFRNAPITIETIFALGGFTIINGRSDEYDDAYGSNSLILDNSSFPYFLKGEVKIGFVFP